MGTKYLTAVIINEEVKVAQFGQNNGYPEASGIRILDFLRHTDLNEFRNAVLKTQLIDDSDLMRAEEEYNNYRHTLQARSEYSRRLDLEFSESGKRIVELDREYLELPYINIDFTTGCHILRYILEPDIQPLPNYFEFARDSLFCEWAYIIDLDANTLEVFKGFNTQPLSEGERFYAYEGLEKYKDTERYEEAYEPVRFVVAFDLNDLPCEAEFLVRIESVVKKI
jgi:hypothetical protein